MATVKSIERRHQTLKNHPCPYCRRGLLSLNEDGTNVCPKCGGEVVTEWEYQRRLQQEQ